MRLITHIINTGAGDRELRGYLPTSTQRAHYRGQRPAVIIYPGGAYAITFEGEAEPIALAFAAAGIAAFVLDYSVTSRTEAVWPYAQTEAFAAIRFVRENAAEFGIRPDNIATLGFSAGGHLCGCTATLWNKPIMAPYLEGDVRMYRPDKAVLCYPVIRSAPPCNQGSFVNLLTGAGQYNAETLAALAIEEQVDDETPPSFLWTTAEDRAVPIQGALEYAHALADHGIHQEMHIYPHGGHGLCLVNHVTEGTAFGEDPEAAAWIENAVRFLYDERLTR